MKPRIVLVAVLSVLVLAVGLAWFLWPRHSLLRLKVVRQTVEQGKPVVIFRLEVADSRRVAIRNVERITVDKTDSPYKEFGFTYSRPMPTPAFALGAFSNTASLGPLRPANEFWAPSQSSPLFDPTRSRREFGVLVPAYAAVWRLRVKVEIEADPSVRFKRSLV